MFTFNVFNQFNWFQIYFPYLFDMDTALGISNEVVNVDADRFIKSLFPEIVTDDKYIDFYKEEIAPSEPVNEKQRFYNFHVKAKNIKLLRSKLKCVF